MEQMVRPNPGQEIGDQIARLRQMWADAFNARDLEQLVGFYAEDAVLLAANVPAAIGIASIRELLEKLFESGISELRIQSKQVEYTGPLAVEISMYALKARSGKNGMQNENGRIVSTWRRFANGEFRITICVWSSGTGA